MTIKKNDKKTINKDKFEHLKWFVIGKPMSGKTTFADQFPKALFFNTDGNYKQLGSDYVYLENKVYEVQGYKLNAWQYFIYSITSNEKDNDISEYDTIVIDLIENLYEYCRTAILQQYGAKDEQGLGAFGNGYKAISEEFMKGIKLLTNLNKTIVFVGHQKITPIKTLDGATVDSQYGSYLPNAVQDKLSGICQVIGRVDIVKLKDENNKLVEKHVLYLNEDQSIAANRMGVNQIAIELYYESWVELTNSILKGGE